MSMAPPPTTTHPDVAPPLPRRAWGLVCQLPTTRSARSWGVGDLTDLGAVARWAAGRGAAVLSVSPLCDQLPVLPRQTSPYSPSSRRWLDPLVADPQAVPHAAGDPTVEALAAAGRARCAAPLVDRDAAWTLKTAAFRHLVDRVAPDLDELVDRHGTPLLDHARASALAARHGSGWRQAVGGTQLTDLGDPADRRELTYWCWLQDETARQLDAVTAGAGDLVLVGDLPVGVDPGGADAWALGDAVADGWTVGAPPDEFNTAGQDWGLAPLDPDALAADDHRALRAVLRANLERFGGLRVDHVMGLFRLWWVPSGGDPAAGHYVRYDADAALGVLVEEARRAGAFLVGEDLGTVEPGVRERLAELGIAGMNVAWFEDRPAADWPADNLGMLTTHDLPTVAGALRGTATEGPGAHPGLAERIRHFAGVGPDAAPDDVIVAAHAALAGGASRLVVATLEDLVGAADPVNVPGTVQPENWSRPLPVRIEDLDEHSLVGRVLEVLARR